MKIYSYQTKNEKSGSKKIASKKPKKKSFWKKTFLWGFRLAALGVFLFALLFLYYSKDLPDPNKLLERQVAESTKIYARGGELLYEIHGETKRTLVELNQISEHLKNATVAIEDKTFYQHKGLYFKGIIRSVLKNFTSFRRSQGGSTITQQFVKNAILSRDKSYDRKLKEIILSLAIEAKFSKEQILKLYLNEIPYGRNAYGAQAAAETYFGKSAKDLSLAQSAYLAALPQRPSFYNPLGPNRKALEGRKNHILTQMQEQGYISQAQEKEAKEAKVEFNKTKTALIAPHFVLMVQNYLEEKFGEKTLQEGGLKVYTTLDIGLQAIAEKAVKDGVEKNAKKYNAHNAGLAAIDPKTGQILALVGSKDFFGIPMPEGCIPGKNCLFEPNVNVALSERQPGSSFKPYVYITAFKKEYKFSPATMLMDVVTNFGKYGDKDYMPQNYDGKERGPVSVRQALAGSLNLPAVKTLALVGVENAVQTAREMGITSPLSDCGLALVLGGCEVKLLDHVAAFSVLANGGVKNNRTPILKILDKDGRVLEEFKSEPKDILDPQAVYELVDIMSDNSARSFIFGPNSPLTLEGRPVAAKTGTTQKWHDGWALGFTPSLAAGVWAGNNDGSFLKEKADGVLVAAPIWHNFMKEALKGQPAEKFERPANIREIVVDAVSGKLPGAYTPSTKTEVFADFSAPQDYDNVHIAVAFDADTNQPAQEQTPANKIIYKTFTVFHGEKKDDPNWESAVVSWATKNGYVYPPTDAGTATAGNNEKPNVEILEPQDGAQINAVPFTIKITATSKRSINKVEVSLDGKIVQTFTEEPFVFELNAGLNSGRHILAAKTTDLSGSQNDTSVEFTYKP